MIGCNNCAGLSITENLSRGNKYLLIDTHFQKSISINAIENEKNEQIEKENSDESPKVQHSIVSNIHS